MSEVPQPSQETKGSDESLETKVSLPEVTPEIPAQLFETINPDAPEAEKLEKTRFESILTKLEELTADLTEEERLVAVQRIFPQGVEKYLEVRKHAFRDQLTDLPNRAALKRMIERLGVESESELTDTARRIPGHEFVMFDANDFKNLNELTQGRHATGDIALAEMAGTLRGVADEMGLPFRNLFRLGGDEFLVVVSSDPETNEPRGKMFLERAVLSYGHRYFEGVLSTISGNIGETPNEADAHLKEAKDDFKKTLAAEVPEDPGDDKADNLPTKEQ
ncbi:MAG: GGDEF domain-containing protein [Candidatus Saccharimonadia bacterium]